MKEYTNFPLSKMSRSVILQKTVLTSKTVERLIAKKKSVFEVFVFCFPSVLDPVVQLFLNLSFVK